jgi:hypothetical protein
LGESVVVVESLRIGTHSEDDEEAVPAIASDENTVPAVVLFEERLLASESESDRLLSKVAQPHLIGEPIPPRLLSI